MTATDSTPAFLCVGVDGSESALVAAAWAARAAVRDGVRLRVVCVYGADAAYGYAGYGPPVTQEVVDAEVAAAQNAVDSAVRAARLIAPDTQVEGVAVLGRPAAVLTEVSHTANTVVVGTRHLGGIRSFLGSVSADVAERAQCPVVVVAGPGTPDGPVVIATDLSGASPAALGEGFRHAATLQTSVVIVHVYTTPTALPATIDPDGTSTLDTGIPRTVSEHLAGYREQYPHVDVHEVVAMGDPAEQIADTACDAQLLVIANRHRSKLRALMSGATTRTLLSKAACPVEIVHH